MPTNPTMYLCTKPATTTASTNLEQPYRLKDERGFLPVVANVNGARVINEQGTVRTEVCEEMQATYASCWLLFSFLRFHSMLTTADFPKIPGSGMVYPKNTYPTIPMLIDVRACSPQHVFIS